MLPNVRLVLATIAASILLAITGLLVVAAVRDPSLSVGPRPARSALIEDDHPQRQQFQARDAARRAEELSRLRELPGNMVVARPAGALPNVAAPIAMSPPNPAIADSRATADDAPTVPIAAPAPEAAIEIALAPPSEPAMTPAIVSESPKAPDAASVSAAPAATQAALQPPEAAIEPPSEIAPMPSARPAKATPRKARSQKAAKKAKKIRTVRARPKAAKTPPSSNPLGNLFGN